MTRREALSRVQPEWAHAAIGITRPAGRGKKQLSSPATPRVARWGRWMARWNRGTFPLLNEPSGARSAQPSGSQGRKLVFFRPVGSGRPRIPNWEYAAGSHLHPTYIGTHLLS